MQFKNIQSFRNGLFANSGKEHKVADGFLTKLHNIDLDLTGRLKRRDGYGYWDDIQDDNSITSILSLPDVSTHTGFQNKVQSIFPYTDVAGNKFIIVVSNGRVYLETKSGDDKIWICLNPSGNINFDEVSKHIDVKSYLDIVFFNDYQNNVYMYNSQAYSAAGWYIAGNRYIYFARDKIYFRDYADFDTKYHTHAIADITNAADDIIHVDGDYRHHYTVGDTVTVEGNTHAANNTDYTVKSVAYDAGDGETDVEIDGGMDDPTTIDGNIKSQYRIFIDETGTNSGALNIEGKAICDSLISIAFIGAGAEPIATASLLKLGFGLRVGNETTGFFYYVLENQKDQRGTDKCYIIKFNDRFIAEDFVELTMDAAGEVINFGYYDEHIYIWCDDGTIHVLDEDLGDAPLTTGDFASMVAPTNDDSEKQYSLAVDARGIFLKSAVIPFYDVESNYFYEDLEDEYSLDDTITHPLDATIAVGTNPYGVCYGAGYIWVVNNGSNNVSKINPSTDAVVATIAVNIGPRKVCYGAGYIWVVHYGPTPIVSKIDPSTDTVVTTINITGSSCGIYYGAGYIWVAGCGPNATRKIDPATDTVAGIYAGGNTPCGVCYREGSIWVTGYGSNWVTRINAITGVYEAFIPVGTNPYGICYGAGYIWAANYGSANVSKIDPSTNAVVATIGVGTNPYGVCYGAGYIWVNNYADNTVSKINPITDTVVATPAVGTNPHEICYGAGYIWVANYTSNNVTKLKYPGNNEIPFLFWIGFDGNLHYEEDAWENIYMCGIETTLEDIVPLEIETDYVYFGTNMVLDGGVDNGKYARVKFADYTLETKDCENSCKKFMIPGDDKWFMKGKQDSDNFRSSNNWDWAAGLTAYTNYVNLNTYYSNLIFHIYKAVASGGISTTLDKIQHLGTPKTPTLTMDNDATAGFKAYTQLRYYMIYKMYSAKTTMLSTPTEDLTIPQLHSSQDFTATPATDKINCVGHGYVTDDVIHVTSDGTPIDLPAPLAVLTDYYVINEGANDFEVSLTEGGVKIDITDAGTGTHSMIQINDQPVKMILSDLNLKNVYGVSIYQKADVDEIHVYRAQKDYLGAWTDPILISQLEKDSDEYWYVGGDAHTYAEETTEDNTQSYTYSPFTEANAFKYPVNDLEIHKNRLILINRIDYENPNVVQYSDVDMADAIPPDNIRAIEAGDGDYMVAGQSMGDYLYLFKTTRLYAILGDVFDGQLIDIDKTIGTPYKNLILKYNNVCYFMNKDSIYAASGQKVVNLNKERIPDFFDTDRDDCIDFDNVEHNGFAYIDTKKEEVHFYLPQKVDGAAQTTNNLVIIFNIANDFFKTYGYHHDIFHKVNSDNLTTGYEVIMTDYAGNIYQMAKENNDYNNNITYLLRTKEFNLGTDIVNKCFKLIKLVGKYFDNITVNYWIDGEQKTSGTVSKKTSGYKDNALVKTWSNGRANTIKVELTGNALDMTPFEIDEVLIGYVQLRGLR